MRAVRIHQFGSPAVVVIDDLPVPVPGPGEVLLRVSAAGVAPWDALIREGKSAVSPAPPLTLGSDLSGIVVALGPGVSAFHVGDEVFGVTNPQFCGAHAEFAVAAASMIARKPQSLTHLQAASAPVIAVTAWQMLLEYANVKRGQTVAILGAAGNVGAYLVQLAAHAGARIIAVAREKDFDWVRNLAPGASSEMRSDGVGLPAGTVDVVLDTVGGSLVEQFVPAIRPGGKLVSVVSTQPLPAGSGLAPVFFYAEVTTDRLDRLNGLFDAGVITPRVGSVLPLAEARLAHEMLAGAPHERGKIVLDVGM